MLRRGDDLLRRKGVNDGARTHDNRNHNPGLYQLSYAHHVPMFLLKIALLLLPFLACPEGLEPPTLSLEGLCSIQLSYGHSNHNITRVFVVSNARVGDPDNYKSTKAFMLYPAELRALKSQYYSGFRSK
ncbi:MAG: uncharacterized protein K0Q74_1033 [Gammaproteobacteria bacterium]|nr:uncharacterized protein [Gammaproteobacteria bacterium]